MRYKCSPRCITGFSFLLSFMVLCHPTHIVHFFLFCNIYSRGFEHRSSQNPFPSSRTHIKLAGRPSFTEGRDPGQADQRHCKLRSGQYPFLIPPPLGPVKIWVERLQTVLNLKPSASSLSLLSLRRDSKKDLKGSLFPLPFKSLA